MIVLAVSLIFKSMYHDKLRIQVVIIAYHLKQGCGVWVTSKVGLEIGDIWPDNCDSVQLQSDILQHMSKNFVFFFSSIVFKQKVK